MKKFLLGCGVSVLVLLALVVGALFLAYSAGGASQKVFFDAVLSSETKNLHELMHPALLKEIDEPVLAAWMKAVKTKLGNYTGLSASNFDTSTKIENGAKVTESKGTINFEKGIAQSEIRWVDGKIVKFNVQSDQLKDWFTGPETTDLYREQGKQLLTDLLSDKVDDAFAMMHENLQKNMPLDKLKAAMPGVKERFGALKSISYESEKFQPGETPSLDIVYKLVCEKGEIKGAVGFQFVGLKGHILSFNVPAEK